MDLLAGELFSNKGFVARRPAALGAGQVRGFPTPPRSDSTMKNPRYLPFRFFRFCLALAAALAAGAGTLRAQLISENFTSGAGNFTVVSGGTWAVTSGQYVLTNPAQGAAGSGN